jgi:hypothetical protein
MNCAYLKVVGTSAAFTAPKMFVANVGQCTTSEGVELVFPYRGNNVEYGGSYAGMTNVAATTDCAAGNNLDVTVVGSGSGGTSNLSTSNTAATGTRTTLSTTTPGTTSSKASSSSTVKTTATAGCTQGSIQCSSDGRSWSVCVNSAYVNLGAVSPGTKCVNGAIVCLSANTTPGMTTPTTTPTTRPGTTAPTVTTINPGMTTTTRNTNAATTTTAGGSTGCTSGQIKCGADGKSWSMCSNNAYVFMGAVAPGYTFTIWR